ncbi:MAG: DUF3465 domain-containing protein [Casimicrobiaceae bacterium]
MRKVLLSVIALGALYYFSTRPAQRLTQEANAATSAERPRNDTTPRGGSVLTGDGRVKRILADDNEGSRHQRFILELPSGRTVLIAHNIDLAPRVAGLKVGDRVEFSGEFESNPQGGVVHWTHRDPQGRHAAGWLRHDGRTYQ